MKCFSQWGQTMLGCNRLWLFLLAVRDKFSIRLSSLIPLMWWTISVVSKYLPRYFSITNLCSNHLLPLYACGCPQADTKIYPSLRFTRPPFHKGFCSPLTSYLDGIVFLLRSNAILLASPVLRQIPSFLRCL